jgi:hypothetical protein
MVSVLFVAKNSVYKTLGVDCWDEERDALNWPGGNPIVAHPPCRLFCKLRMFSTAPQEEKRLAYWAVDQVREYGGVLEHPSGSELWKECSLPSPGKRDAFGFCYGVEQWLFGHPAKKATWLYIVGCNPTDLPGHPFRMGYADHAIGKCRRRNNLKRSELFDNRKETRSATPPAFARWLIETAERCKTSQLL